MNANQQTSRWQYITRWASGRFARNSVFSMADQVCVSGMRFLTTIVIAKTGGAVELGVYALVLTLALSALIILQTLVMTPFANFKSRVPADEQRIYRAEVFRMSLRLSGYCAAGFTVVGLLLLFASGQLPADFVAEFQLARLGWTTLIAALATPMLVMVEFCRRMWLIEMQAHRAFELDSLITVGLLVSLVLLHVFASITAPGVFMVFAAIYGLGAIGGVVLVWPTMRWPSRRTRSTFDRHWNFGRWVFGSEIISAGRSYVIYWVAGGFLGISATGIFSACESLMRAPNPFFLGIANIAEPSLAARYAESGVKELRRLAIKVAGLMLVLTLPICLGLALFAEELLSLLFQPEFGQYDMVVVWLAAATLINVVGYALASSIQAIDRPHVNFLIRILSFTVVVVLSIILVQLWGLVGVAVAAFVGSLLTFALRVLLFVRYFSPADAAMSVPDAGER